MTTPIYLLVLLFAFGNIFSLPAYSSGPPTIFSCTPQALQQGQITTAVVTGENLNSTYVGVRGGNGDVFAVILKQDPTGMSLTIQFATTPTAIPGEREFFLKNSNQEETTFPIQVTPSGAPLIENVYPSSANPGSTLLLYLTGSRLTNPTITTTSDALQINSYRSSNDGSVVYLSVSLANDVPAGTYQFYVSTLGGQSQADFTVTEKVESNNDDSLNADPYSPGLYSIQQSPLNEGQLILKGAMFDSDPSRNTVTLFENNNGTVTSRQVEVVSSNSNEIVVNLPAGIESDSISFAVSSIDGKASNIKSYNFSSTDLGPDSTTTTATTTNNTNLPETTTTTASSTNSGAAPTSTTTASNTDTTNPSALEQPTKLPPTASNPTQTNNDKTETTEEITIANNIKDINQFLFAGNTDTSNKNSTTTLNEMKDPAKLISSIEENKQIKNQVDLIMIALDEAKKNQDLSDSAKKAESLKLKVDELEKVIELEKQKNKPNQRKIAKYEQLLASASAESRSQTFTLLNNLLKYKPQLKNLLTQKPFDLAAIQSSIPNDAAIIQYVPTEEGLIIFVVDNKNLKTRINKSVTKDILNKDVQDYRQLFEKEIEKIKTTGRVTPIANWKDDKSISYKKDILPLKEKNALLYNELIGPIEKDIANKKVLAIISNSWLRYLPFQSLGKPTKDGDINFLISNKSIVYLDSVIAVSKSIPPAISNMANITVLANPDGSLLGANKEAELITKLFGMSTTSLIQKPFSIALINQLSKKAEVLHLATHGYLDSSDINSSYLVTGKKMVNGKSKQSKLLLKDIYDLDLASSKLVVLSSCDTGKLGSLSNEPDDVVGSLASAFRVAGANTILASLWKAHDEATKIMMQSFYENLKLGYNKGESLRRAELKLKENPKYGHPLFWSLFSLIGDWR